MCRMRGNNYWYITQPGNEAMHPCSFVQSAYLRKSVHEQCKRAYTFILQTDAILKVQNIGLLPVDS